MIAKLPSATRNMYVDGESYRDAAWCVRADGRNREEISDKLIAPILNDICNLFRGKLPFGCTGSTCSFEDGRQTLLPGEKRAKSRSLMSLRFDPVDKPLRTRTESERLDALSLTVYEFEQCER